MESILAPRLSKKLFLADLTSATVTGTTPPREPVPTKPAGAVSLPITNWNPKDGALLFHCDGTMKLAPRPAGATVCGVTPAGAGTLAARSTLRGEECDDLTRKTAIPAATTRARTAAAST